MNETGRAVTETAKFVDPSAQCSIHHTISLTCGHHRNNEEQKFRTSVCQSSPSANTGRNLSNFVTSKTNVFQRGTDNQGHSRSSSDDSQLRPHT